MKPNNTTPIFRDRSGNEYQTGALIGKGGEGAVYKIAGHPQSAAKIWHPNTDRHAAARKLQIMTRRGPVITTHSDSQIIWPQTLLYDAANKPAGYLMPRLQPNRWEPILKYYTPALAKHLAKERGQTISMTLRNLMARNICHAVHAIHQAGYIIGDINENNILATPEGCIAIIDCDSFQVRDTAGAVFPVTKIRPEFQPPELQNIPGRDITRQPNHDAFALAVLLFKLLCQGLHPHDGTVKHPTRHPDLNTQAQRIKAGIFYPDRPEVLQVSADWQQHWDDLNPPTQSRFIKTFTSGQRTKPDEWLTALTESQQDQGRQTIAPPPPPPPAKRYHIVITALTDGHRINITEQPATIRSHLERSLTKPWEIILVSPAMSQTQARTLRQEVTTAARQHHDTRYRQLTGYSLNYRPKAPAYRRLKLPAALQGSRMYRSAKAAMDNRSLRTALPMLAVPAIFLLIFGFNTFGGDNGKTELEAFHRDAPTASTTAYDSHMRNANLALGEENYQQCAHHASQALGSALNQLANHSNAERLLAANTAQLCYEESGQHDKANSMSWLIERYQPTQ